MIADIHEKLESHQANLIKQIEAAARTADTAAILSLNDELRQTASLLGRVNDLTVEARSILGPDSVPGPPPPNALPSVRLPERVAGRGYGIQIRSGFLDRSLRDGVRLRPHRGAIYASPSGRRVGIAVATERKPDRWFLGLGENDFDSAVLLCAQNSGKVIDICLPARFIAEHKAQFSRSGGQIKFNIARRDGRLLLKIPNHAAERVDQFVGAFTGLDA